MSTESVQIAIKAWLDGDLHEAESLLLNAADNGCGRAAHELGTLYATGGLGLDPDQLKSRFWFDRSLASGYEAQISTDPSWFR